MAASPVFRPTRRAVLAAAPAALAASSVAARPTPLTLERPLLGDTLTLRSDPRFAGAVSGVRFRGMEYADAADHGRLLQSAIHFDGLGECLNPTQGGASSDERTSTSRLLWADVSPERWAVRTQMAYWLRPGQTCDLPGRPRARAANMVALSPVTLDAVHRFGVLAAENATLADLRYTTAQPHRSAVVEALTIYMPPAFSRLWGWDARRWTPAEPAAEQPRPYALATTDNAHAFAIFSPRGAPPARFGGFSYGVVGKLNAVFRPEGTYGAGGHDYRLAWAVGTLEEIGAAVSACA